MKRDEILQRIAELGVPLDITVGEMEEIDEAELGVVKAREYEIAMIECNATEQQRLRAMLDVCNAKMVVLAVTKKIIVSRQKA